MKDCFRKGKVMILVDGGALKQFNDVHFYKDDNDNLYTRIVAHKNGLPEILERKNEAVLVVVGDIAVRSMENIEKTLRAKSEPA